MKALTGPGDCPQGGSHSHAPSSMRRFDRRPAHFCRAYSAPAATSLDLKVAFAVRPSKLRRRRMRPCVTHKQPPNPFKRTKSRTRRDGAHRHPISVMICSGWSIQRAPYARGVPPRAQQAKLPLGRRSGARELLNAPSSGWGPSGSDDRPHVLQQPTRDPRDPGVLMLLAHDLRAERHACDRHEGHRDRRCEQHGTWKVENGITGRAW